MRAIWAGGLILAVALAAGCRSGSSDSGNDRSANVKYGQWTCTDWLDATTSVRATASEVLISAVDVERTTALDLKVYLDETCEDGAAGNKQIAEIASVGLVFMEQDDS